LLEKNYREKDNLYPNSNTNVNINVNVNLNNNNPNYDPIISKVEKFDSLTLEEICNFKDLNKVNEMIYNKVK